MPHQDRRYSLYGENPGRIGWDSAEKKGYLAHTITADNRKELAKHEEIAQKLELNFYFCKPCHSWKRGANENTNRLIRQDIPRGTDFSEITDGHLT